MTTINLTSLDAANTSINYIMALNDASGGWIAGMIVIVVFGVSFLSSIDRYDDFNQPLFISSGITVVVTALLVFSGFIGMNILWYPLIIFIVSIGVMRFLEQR